MPSSLQSIGALLNVEKEPLWNVIPYPYEILGQLWWNFGDWCYFISHVRFGDKSGETASHGRMPISFPRRKPWTMLYTVGRCPAGKWCGVPMTLKPCCNVLLAHVSLQHSTSLMAFAKTRSWQESRCALSLSLCAQCSFPVGCTTNSQKICLVFVLPCMLGKTLQEHFFYKKCLCLTLLCVTLRPTSRYGIA